MTDSSKLCAQCQAKLPDDATSSLCPTCLLQIGFETQDGGGELQGSSGSYTPSFIPPTAEELSPHFPQLEIVEVIGHGGMGVVYKARQTELDRIVALKILRPGISEDPDFAERFQREARALARLNHPNIITVFDFGRRDALFYFVMEFVDGTNLRHLERAGQLQPAEALNIVPQVCSALQYAHDNGVVHRDIKPENILIGKDGEVRIADFGLAKLAGVVDSAPLTGTWQVMGTPHYMAPEQFEKPTTVDHRADIYSLGVVIYELLTGELPLGRFPLPSERAHVDVRLDEVVLRSLEKAPERRYQHVTDVATAVKEASTPTDESQLAQAAEWVRNTAGSVTEGVADGARTIRDRLPQVNLSAPRWFDVLAARTRGLGQVLIWLGVFDFVFAFWFHGQLGPPGSDFIEFLTLMTVVASCLSFYAGRRLRTGKTGGRFRTIVGFCCIPWFGFPPISIARAVVALAALAATFGKANNGGETSDEPGPDFFAGFVSAAKSFLSWISIRTICFTVIGIGGWLALCALSFAVLHEVWYLDNIPSTYGVRDNSAANVESTHGVHGTLNIYSDEYHDTTGLRFQRMEFERNGLTLDLSQGPSLNVDLGKGTCQITVGKEVVSDGLPIDVSTVREWMKQSDVDLNHESLNAEIIHLCDLMLLMRRTRGVSNRLTLQDRESFPTLSRSITSILQDDKVMREKVIPVGRLLAPEFFVRPDNINNARWTLYVQQWAENLYFGVFSTLGAIGFLRVIRVLYVHLWRKAKSDLTSTRAVAIAGWRRISLSLVGSAIIAIVALLGANYILATSYEHALAAESDGELISIRLLNQILITLMILAATIAICGILARPVLRTTGWWIGSLGATLAILIVPLSLFTFPTGLAAWIGLTTRDVKNLFQSVVTRDETMSTATDIA